MPENWLNDAAKRYPRSAGDFALFLSLGHLQAITATPAYLLAMKCLAMRLGEEFHDEADVRYLLRDLDIERYDAAIGVLGRYYPEKQFPQKTLYALQEMLDAAGS